MFAAAPLLYQLNDDGGYVLLSVGPDGQHDEIPEDGTEDAEDSGDDLMVPMPAAGQRNVQQ